jgi:hypothetical protein
MDGQPELFGAKLPVVRCEAAGKSWRFWCPFCRTYHRHGAISGPRAPHCHTAEGRAAFPLGYDLVGPSDGGAYTGQLGPEFHPVQMKSMG